MSLKRTLKLCQYQYVNNCFGGAGGCQGEEQSELYVYVFCKLIMPLEVNLRTLADATLKTLIN